MLAVSAASAAAMGCTSVLRRWSSFEHRADQGRAKRFEPILGTGLLITSWVIVDAIVLLTVLLDCAGIELGPAVPELKAEPPAPGAV